MYLTLFNLEAQNAAAPKLPRFKNQKPAAGGARIAKYCKNGSVIQAAVASRDARAKLGFFLASYLPRSGSRFLLHLSGSCASDGTGLRF